MTNDIKESLIEWAEIYNSPEYFKEDPIAFPAFFAGRYGTGGSDPPEGRNPGSLQDVEIAAVFAAHFAWGRRDMIVRDCSRLFDEMGWRPYDYVMAGDWRNEDVSIHRTVKWSEVAAICRRLRDIYSATASLECLSVADFRERIYGQRPDPTAANKKINMLLRWMVRDDGKVDLGLWRKRRKAELLIPLDVHVFDVATRLGLTTRRQKNLNTAEEITASFNEIFPGDPCKGDFALFGYGVTHQKQTAGKS